MNFGIRVNDSKFIKLRKPGMTSFILVQALFKTVINNGLFESRRKSDSSFTKVTANREVCSCLGFKESLDDKK